MHLRYYPAMRGFTLLELSIVLVIIGLLIGGVMVGQDLVRASQVNAVTTEYARYREAAGAFKDKYLLLPGDFTSATNVWGTATCPGTSASPSTTTATCNGDGDGTIEQQTGVAVGDSREMFQFWKHLANAGLISGTYTGTNSGGWDVSTTIDVNIPHSKLSGAGWNVQTLGVVDLSSTTYFEGEYHNVLVIGGNRNNSIANAAVLSPLEASSIDVKMDDDLPGNGLVRTYESSTTCHNSTTSAAAARATVAAYTKTTTGRTCSLIFKLNL